MLAGALEKFKGQDAVVYSLPRGVVVLGYEISRHLNAPRAEEEIKEANRRRRVYLQGRPPLEARGKVAIVVDEAWPPALPLSWRSWC